MGRMVDKSPVPSRGVQTSFNRPEDPGKGNEQKRDRINAAFETIPAYWWNAEWFRGVELRSQEVSYEVSTADRNKGSPSTGRKEVTDVRALGKKSHLDLTPLARKPRVSNGSIA